MKNWMVFVSVSLALMSCSDDAAKHAWNVEEAMKPVRQPVMCEGSQKVVTARTSLDTTCVHMCDGSIQCMGARGMSGQLGNGQNTPSEAAFQKVSNITNARSLHVQLQHSCTVLESDEMWCWGANHVGQLGHKTPDAGGIAFSSVPVQVPVGVPVARIVRMGMGETCVTATDGALYCWGEFRGGCRCSHEAIVVDEPTRVEGVKDVLKVVNIGENPDELDREFCGLHKNGEVSCWVKAAHKVGTSRFDTSNISGAVDLISYQTGACALLQGGDVLCWGRTRTGMIYDREQILKPQRIPGIQDAVEISTGYSETCARTREGRVWCWGESYPEVLGATGLEPVPSAVADLEDATSLTQDDSYLCATRTSGALACWGLGVHEPSDVPGLQGVTQVAHHDWRSCAIDGDAEVWCWRHNRMRDAQGKEVVFTQPQRVPEARGAKTLLMKEGEACTLRQDDTMVCWDFAKEGAQPPARHIAME